MKFKRFAAAALAAVMVIGTLAGCGAKQAAPAAGDKKEAEDFEVILDWYPNAIHSFLYLADEKGYFAEEGLNVKLTAPAGFSDPLTFPAAGKADCGLYYQNDVITAYGDEDMDIQIIGAVTQDYLCVMIAMAESGINSPADFKGAKIGYSGSTALKAQIVSMAEEAGLSESDYELVDVGFDIITAITTGAVDVVAGGMVNNEVVELRNAGYDITYWSACDFGVPRMYDIVMVVNGTDYKANPDRYERFMNACKKGFKDVCADKEAALDVLFAHEDAENYALDRKMETESLDTLLDIEEKSGAEFLSMDKKVWDDLIQWMAERDLVKNPVDPTEYANVK